MTDFEDEYLDVLHNIETAITAVYRQYPDVVDFEVDRALNTLVRAYKAQQRERAFKPPRLSPNAQIVYDSVGPICEWRLGNISLENEDGNEVVTEMEPRSLTEIINCINRIRKSIKLWTKQGGRQGYLNFIVDFIL